MASPGKFAASGGLAFPLRLRVMFWWNVISESLIAMLNDMGKQVKRSVESPVLTIGLDGGGLFQPLRGWRMCPTPPPAPPPGLA